MKRLSLFFLLASVALWSARPLAQGATSTPAKPAAKPAAGAGRLIEIIGTDAGGKYLFKPSVINAKPGEALLVRLRSVAGTMGNMPKMAMSHNFVLIRAGVDAQKFVNDGIAAGFTGDYLPKQKDQMLASTPLAGVGETVEVSFKAPAAGSYPFVCTFPGHYVGGMKGTLVVK
jgi:azurin